MRELTQDGDGDGSGDENEGSNGDGNEYEIEDGKGKDDGEENGGGGALWYPPHQENKSKDQALPFRMRHYLCRYKMTPVDSRQLLAQDPALA